MERNVSFSVGDLRFIDSFQFMTSSLETLMNNLPGEGLSHFRNFTNIFKNQDIENFKKKFDCCDYIDTYERFEETYLPPKQAFYNRLKNNTFPRKIRHTFKQCNKNLT